MATIKKMQKGGKTGAQLKKEGITQMGKGMRMKMEGQKSQMVGKGMKAKGEALKTIGTAKKQIGQDQFLERADRMQDHINYRTRKGQIQDMNPEMLAKDKAQINRAKEIKKARTSKAAIVKKYATGGATKMQKGGSAEIVGMPKYGNNPRTQTGAMLKKGGSVAKAKFGASVPVQHSPAPGRVRSASGVGTVAVGKRKMGGVTKKLVKAQTGGTPFQKYMKTPGAVASDTTMQTVSPSMEKLSGPGVWNAPKKPVAKSSKNQKALENAYDKTYGEGYRNETGQPAKGETMEQYKRRMGPMKKGGTVKKYAKGGSAKSFPDLNKDGKITKADILKGRGVIKRKGGAVKKK
jgi:hypothetical protein